ncbi:hypothetical protein J2772_000628 [Chryseobacterium jejuense]|nr:hypothetical protein [Chryseobacterium jejuense]
MDELPPSSEIDDYLLSVDEYYFDVVNNKDS